MAWLLDTNIISEKRRLKPEPKVLAFLADHPLDDLYISTVTLAELRFGIELLRDGDNRRDELNDWITNEIRPDVRPARLADNRRRDAEVAKFWCMMVEKGATHIRNLT